MNKKQKCITVNNFNTVISEGPRFTQEPIDQTVIEGGNVAFLCRAEGNPAPDITWLKQG